MALKKNIALFSKNKFILDGKPDVYFIRRESMIVKIRKRADTKMKTKDSLYEIYVRNIFAACEQLIFMIMKRTNKGGRKEDY